MNRIDLHIHSTISDGTDTPEEILAKVREAGISLFSLTDHDAVRGCLVLQKCRQPEDPQFLPGVEFSCKDEAGKYHILGYAFDPEAEPIRRIVTLGHTYRMNKLRARLAFLEEEFGFTFSRDELDALFAMDNPGKPHIGNMMVRAGYVKTKEEAIRQYINRISFRSEYVRPEEAISGILESGGIPVLAHPSYGSGDQLILGAEMEARLRFLIGYGLQGVEALYSGFTEKLRNELLTFAEQFDLFVTAGSDYHGTNRLVSLGDTGLLDFPDMPERLQTFLETVSPKQE